MDEHVSIQSESLAVAGALQLRHPLVVAAIKQLLQESRVWSIKLDALRALACIGQWDQELVRELMWMVRFEKLPAVRVEACRTIGRLGLRDRAVMESLKALVTVEDEEEVVREARQTLATMGAEEHVSDEMLEKVCQTVRELGSKEAITNTILDIGSQAMADYVLDKRSHKPISARDYLNNHYRSVGESPWSCMCFRENWVFLYLPLLGLQWNFSTKGTEILAFVEIDCGGYFLLLTL